MSITYREWFNEVKEAISGAKKSKLTEASIHVRNKTVEKLSGTGKGRTYRVPGTSRYYTASSPGDPPTVLFGDLRQSINFEVESDTGYVGSVDKKSKWLEFGTPNMAARPFLKPTFEEEAQEIARILGKEWFK